MCAWWVLPVHNLYIKHNFCGMKLGYLVLYNLEYVSTWILCAILLNVNNFGGGGGGGGVSINSRIL